jgi:hypothetical protein
MQVNNNQNSINLDELKSNILKRLDVYAKENQKIERTSSDWVFEKVQSIYSEGLPKQFNKELLFNSINSADFEYKEELLKVTVGYYKKELETIASMKSIKQKSTSTDLHQITQVIKDLYVSASEEIYKVLIKKHKVIICDMRHLVKLHENLELTNRCYFYVQAYVVNDIFKSILVEETCKYYKLTDAQRQSILKDMELHFSNYDKQAMEFSMPMTNLDVTLVVNIGSGQIHH